MERLSDDPWVRDRIHSLAERTGRSVDAYIRWVDAPPRPGVSEADHRYYTLTSLAAGPLPLETQRIIRDGARAARAA
ncbi:hypothetical protein GCM10027294_25310 [Marinactinospora endophytica]